MWYLPIRLSAEFADCIIGTLKSYPLLKDRGYFNRALIKSNLSFQPVNLDNGILQAITDFPCQHGTAADSAFKNHSAFAHDSSAGRIQRVMISKNSVKTDGKEIIDQCAGGLCGDASVPVGLFQAIANADAADILVDFIAAAKPD